jgi:hypothetical protein
MMAWNGAWVVGFGELGIVEILRASQAGPGAHAEFVEDLEEALDLRGLQRQAPTGAGAGEAFPLGEAGVEPGGQFLFLFPQGFVEEGLGFRQAFGGEVPGQLRARLGLDRVVAEQLVEQGLLPDPESEDDPLGGSAEDLHDDFSIVACRRYPLQLMDIILGLLEPLPGHHAAPFLVHFEHVRLRLLLVPSEDLHEHVGDVVHEVDRVVPDDDQEPGIEFLPRVRRLFGGFSGSHRGLRRR